MKSLKPGNDQLTAVKTTNENRNCEQLGHSEHGTTEHGTTGLWSFRTRYHSTQYHWTVDCGADDLTDVKAGAPTQVFLMERLIGDQCVGARTVFD